MQDARELIQKIRAEARSDNVSGPRWVRTCAPGDEIRQGDVYLYPMDTPTGAAEQELSGSGPLRLNGREARRLWGSQLAPGETPGSRHILEGEAKLYHCKGGSPLEGPLVCATERVLLTHPEHADISVPAGWYEVRYQQDFEERETTGLVWIDALPRRVFD